MLILKREKNIISIENNKIVSFFNEIGDVLCVFLSEVDSNRFYSTIYLFKTKSIPSNIDLTDTNEVLDLIEDEDNDPFMLLTCSSEDDHLNIYETKDILNKLKFNIDIQWQEDSEKILMN